MNLKPMTMKAYNQYNYDLGWHSRMRSDWNAKIRSREIMFALIKDHCDLLVETFDEIPLERKVILENISKYIAKKVIFNLPVNLLCISNNNSQRSQFAQIWTKVAARYYNIPYVYTFSGGTEVSAIKLDVINLLEKIGFRVKPMNLDKNSFYHVYYSDREPPLTCFSKLYSDERNPDKDFAAIFTSSEAEKKCSFIPGVELRAEINYNNPAGFENARLREVRYDQPCRQIATEALYLFSKIK